MGVHDVLDYLHIFTKSMQGLLNSLVYFRPKYLAARSRYKTETWLECLCRVLELPIHRCISKQRTETTQQQHQQENGMKRAKENAETDQVQVHYDDHLSEVCNVDDCEEGFVEVSTLTTGTFDNGQVMLSSMSSTSVPKPQSAPT